MRNPWPPTDRARDLVAAKTRRGRIGHRSRRNLAGNFAQRNRHSEVRLPTIRVTARDREGVEPNGRDLEKVSGSSDRTKGEFLRNFHSVHAARRKYLPYNHPLVPLIAAGLTRQGVTYREPDPAFLKAAIAGGLRLTRTTDTSAPKVTRYLQNSLPIQNWLKPRSTITSSHIEYFRHTGLSVIRSTIDRTARSQFDIVNATYLRVRAFARRMLCRRSG